MNSDNSVTVKWTTGGCEEDGPDEGGTATVPISVVYPPTRRSPLNLLYDICMQQ